MCGLGLCWYVGYFGECMVECGYFVFGVDGYVYVLWLDWLVVVNDYVVVCYCFGKGGIVVLYIYYEVVCF